MATDRPWDSGRNTHPRHWNRPRLTPAQREEIRRRLADGENPTDLAAEYGVSRGCITGYR